MRVRLKGINRVCKKLADGSFAIYWYAWKGGPRIRDPRTKDGQADFMAAVANQRQPDRRRLLSLTRKFQDSADWATLAPRTQSDYRRQIALIENRFGAMPVQALSDRRARGVFKDWRDEIAKRSLRQADYAWTVLSRILSWSLDRGLIDKNPCQRGGRLYHGTRAEIIWCDEDEAKFLAVASEQLRRAYLLAVWTGQRPGDVLSMTWSSYDGERIRVRTAKTGSFINVLCGQPLCEALNTAERTSTRIITNQNGLPYTGDGFRSVWRKTMLKAGLSGLRFNDLRGTAVTRLASVGCSVPQIRSITGHTLQQINAILEAHYLAHDQGLADDGIRKLETRTQSPNRIPNCSIGSGSKGEKSS